MAKKPPPPTPPTEAIPQPIPAGTAAALLMLTAIPLGWLLAVLLARGGC